MYFVSINYQQNIDVSGESLIPFIKIIVLMKDHYVYIDNSRL